MNKIYIIVFFIMFLSSKLYSQKYYSGPAGNWCTEPDGKGKCINSPKDKDELIVDRHFTVPGPFTSKGKVKIVPGGKLTVTNLNSGDMDVFGTLEIEEKAMLVVERNLSFRNKSKVDVDEGGTILVSGNFRNFNNSIDVKIDGKLEISGDFDNGNHAKIQGNGTVSIAGTCSNKGEVFEGKNTCAGIKNLLLPVELLFFEAKVVDKNVHLYWATVMESNFDFFTVERSNNAKDFVSVGEPVKGVGNSNEVNNYNFIDTNPLAGKSYYRLKATDFDGSVEYHPVIVVDVAGETNIQLFPNPNRGNSINFSIDVNPEKNSFFKIYNIIGEEVFRAKFHAGLNEYFFEQPLEKGLYIVIVENGNSKKQMKLTIQ